MLEIEEHIGSTVLYSALCVSFGFCNKLDRAYKERADVSDFC